MVENGYLDGIKPNAVEFQAEIEVLIVFLGLIKEQQPIKHLRLYYILVELLDEELVFDIQGLNYDY